MPVYSVTFEMVDFYGRTARKSYETVSTMANEAAAMAAAAGLATDLGLVTEMRILSYTVGQRIVYTDTVTNGANRDEGLTLVLRKQDNFKGVLKVPGPLNDIFDEGTGIADIAHAGVAAFAANFLVDGDFVFSDGEQAIELLSGRLDK